MANRYFIAPPANGTAVITGDDAAHLCRVLRAAPGDKLTLCDGVGFDYDVEIESFSKSEIVCKILSKQPSLAEPALHVTVYIGFAKGERMDWAVQKAVELGASAIVPFFSERVVVKLKDPAEKTARFARIAAEAAKQSGRGKVPVVRDALPFDAMLEAARKADDTLFFYEAGGKPLAECVGTGGSIALVTGCEGGFSPAEAEAARAAGCVAVGLGPRILRSETAVAVAIAGVMLLRGELQ